MFASVLFAGLLTSFAFAQGYYPNYYNDHPYYYDYDRKGDVECRPERQTVVAGSRAYFVADGGDGDYRWQADGHRYSHYGRFFSYVFYEPGTERVDVTSDGEESSCYVRVVDRGYVSLPLPPHQFPSYQPNQPVTLTTSYMPPALPNTGFDPNLSPMIAFAVVLFAGCGIIAYPYARKAFAAIG